MAWLGSGWSFRPLRRGQALLRPRIEGSKDWNPHPHPGCFAHVVTSPQNLLPPHPHPQPPQQGPRAGGGGGGNLCPQPKLLTLSDNSGKANRACDGSWPGLQVSQSWFWNQVPPLGINERTPVLRKLLPSENSSYKGHVIQARPWAPLQTVSHHAQNAPIGDGAL